MSSEASIWVKKKALAEAVKTLSKMSAYEDRWKVGPSDYERHCPNGSGRNSVSIPRVLLEVGDTLGGSADQ